MPLLDNQLVISDAQAVTTTVIGTNVIDLTKVGNPIHRGRPMYAVITVATAVTATGAATVAFNLEADSATGLGATPTVLYTKSATGKAALTAGARVMRVAIPEGIAATDRYIGVRYTVANGPLTAGKFDARLELDPQDIDVAV